MLQLYVSLLEVLFVAAQTLHNPDQQIYFS